MLFYDPQSESIFASDDEQTDPIYEISRDQVPDLIANGATVDPSANDLVGKSDSSPGDGSATMAELGNANSDPRTAASSSDASPTANAFVSTESVIQTAVAGSSSSLKNCDEVGNVSGSTSSRSDAASSSAGSTERAMSSASGSTPEKSSSHGDDHA